uniref:Uncharacterized protein n=1 Tax=Rheinheimera sp. BAL341 TaxID=1708203 RepID=A0A486XNH0_9GAMM
MELNSLAKDVPIVTTQKLHISQVIIRMLTPAPPLFYLG